MNKYAIVLAAGKGTRMRSQMPKVLHRVLGKPMLSRVLEATSKAQIENQYVVIGHGSDQVEKVLDDSVKLVFQKEQLGTATLCARRWRCSSRMSPKPRASRSS